jgi:hypothetical protein
MLQDLLKIAAPLVLLLALIFLTGASTATASSPDLARADLCCDLGDERPSLPSDECSDTACGCFSCISSIMFPEFRIPPSISQYHPPPLALPGSMLSGHGRSIAYPPEPILL